MSGEPDAGPARRADKAPKNGERVSIPGGAFVAGSTPGDEGRDPLAEPLLIPVDMGPFEIDKLPYPNDPTKPAKTDVTREEARALCQERGERLCTELEWERACKGTHNDIYAHGNTWDTICSKEPNSCASGYGVLAMGSIREWTTSDLLVTDSAEKSRPVVRGGANGADAVDRRCAHRGTSDATAKGNDLGFRCCKGAPNAAAIPPIRVGEPSFKRFELEISKVNKMVTSIPQLAHYAKDLAYFTEKEAIEVVMNRGDAGSIKPGPVITTGPVLWNPVANDEVVVLALKAKNASMILAYYRLPDEKYRLASSLVLKDEPGPMVLSFTNFQKKRVTWSTCWECPGEQGAVELKDGKRVVVVQH